MLVGQAFPILGWLIYLHYFGRLSRMPESSEKVISGCGNF
jgi:hypothetical protein